jgi:Zn-finger nucleic acid-binding protein
MSTLLCPACMVELKLAERQGVEIDYCPQCRGVWLDRGELDKIMEHVRATTASQGREDGRFFDRDRAERSFDREHYEEEQYARRRGRRRKSFLEELFDFD